MIDGLAAVITTSPSPNQPSTAHIETTINSVADVAAHTVVMADGIHPDYRGTAAEADYRDYLDRLTTIVDARYDVTLRVSDEWLHHANLFRRGLALIDEPLVLAMEHDTPIVIDRPIEWEGICGAVRSEAAHSVRLHYDWQIHPAHRHLLLDRNPRLVAGIRAYRTAQFTTRTHVASVDWYRALFDEFIGADTRAFTETVLHGVVANRVQRFGDKGWDRFRLWIYAPEGDNLQRSYHLDSRPGPGDEHEVVIAYDGPVPADAPRPTGGS